MTTKNQEPPKHGPHGPGCRCGMDNNDLRCAVCDIPIPEKGTACGECMLAGQPTRFYCESCGFKHITGHAIAQVLGESANIAAATLIGMENAFKQRRKQQKGSLN